MQVHTCVILFILATTLMHAHSERIQLKGNLLFTELGGQSLNQEYVIFVRSLNTSDLRLLATYLRQSIGGAGFHRSGISPKRHFTEVAFHRMPL